MQYDIGLIGLGVMGQNLARNLANQKFSVLVFNRHTEKAKAFIEKYGNDHLSYRPDYASFVRDLKPPRKIFIMVQAGAAVEEVIQSLNACSLGLGDVLIDAGNSYYPDTQRRAEILRKQGLQFVGLGVSGGEEGALKGPSLMPGCEDKTWKVVSPILKKIAAKDFAGKPCVTHVGPDGAGHYVKMVHNGIEYGIMQMMSEAYQLLKTLYRLSADEIAAIFKQYNQGKLQSFLFEIAVPVLTRPDEFKKGHLIDFILDKAGQKGTGRWVAIDALEQSSVLPTITMAVFARSLSAFKAERMVLSRFYKHGAKKPTLPLKTFVAQLEQALYAGILSCYAQGFEQIAQAAGANEWKIDFAEVARIWEGGCIIRAKLLNFLHKAFGSAKGKAVHLFTIQPVRKALQDSLAGWQEVVSLAVRHGVPVPTLYTSLDYFLSLTSAQLPANFIQGLRDYFGAHTYERTDRPGSFHTQWL